MSNNPPSAIIVPPVRRMAKRSRAWWVSGTCVGLRWTRINSPAVCTQPNQEWSPAVCLCSACSRTVPKISSPTASTGQMINADRIDFGSDFATKWRRRRMRKTNEHQIDQRLRPDDLAPQVQDRREQQARNRDLPRHALAPLQP